MNQNTLSTVHPESLPLGDNPTPTNRERFNAAASVSERGSSNHNPIPPSAGPTGPRTPNGKLRSSLNAIKHGLRASKPENAVPDDMRALYEAMRKQYIAEYRPAGATEHTLLDMVIHAAWQLYRIRQMELFAPIEFATPLDSSSFGKSDRLARYRASFERMFHLNLNQLKQIQQERILLAADRAAVLPAHIPPGVRLQPIFKLLDNVAWRPHARTATYTAQQSPSPERPGTRNSSFIRP